MEEAVEEVVEEFGALWSCECAWSLWNFAQFAQAVASHGCHRSRMDSSISVKTCAFLSHACSELLLLFFTWPFVVVVGFWTRFANQGGAVKRAV